MRNEGSWMSEILSPLAYQLGIGGIGGLVIGYAFKKISKLIIVLIGFFIIVLFYLGVRGIISINYDALWKALANSLGMAESAFSWIVGVISLLPLAGSLVVGFLLGFKLG
jgi:uncharacterized membrane protein (Fun14 family)